MGAGMGRQQKQSKRITLRDDTHRKMKCEAGKDQTIYRDAKQRSLALRVTAAGNKAYVFESKLDKATIRISLGDPANMTIKQARMKAAEYRLMVQEGKDPRVAISEQIAADNAKRQKTRIESEPAIDVWQAYLEARKPRWSERHYKDHVTMSRTGGEPITRGKRAGMPSKKEPGILRGLLELPLKKITRDEVANWLDKEVDRRPTRARLALSLLSTFLNWCNDRPEYRSQVNLDACSRFKRDMPKPQPRMDCLQREQLALWFEHVGRIKNRTISAYLKTLLLTGARRNELAALRWADVDFQWGSMTIHDKVDGERTISMPPYVAHLLANLPHENGFIFASKTSKSGHITEPRIAHNRALEQAGLPPLSIHGLRRSFGTLAEWVECPTGIVAQIMGHKPSAIAERHYRRRPLDLLRKWHTKIEAFILSEAGLDMPEQKTGKVRVLRRVAV